MKLEDVLDHNAHIAYYEWLALGDKSKTCYCIHCQRYRWSKL